MRRAPLAALMREAWHGHAELMHGCEEARAYNLLAWLQDACNMVKGCSTMTEAGDNSQESKGPDVWVMLGCDG